MTSDFLSLVLQAAGGAFAAMSDGYNSGRVGANIMIAGLILQVLSLGIFLLVCADLTWRCRHGVTTQDQGRSRVRRYALSKLFLGGVIVATLSILVRSIFRTIELWEGFSGELWNGEPEFMDLDGAMVALASLMLAAFHPGPSFVGSWTDGNWSFEIKAGMTKDENDSTETVNQATGSGAAG